ncbi:methyl-accepting chemotaxis protein [Kamptonema formosum]|uniref:methyl-accepting chemotaxis protein n=1 Tax=Kamptonema formosum TaxID=331992 RepID=UPI0004774D0A|nr:methyl-accepting chemotaxis protein [Oscillatoria sp. PCC 10802]
MLNPSSPVPSPRRSLRSKAVLLSVALSTVPVLLIGGLAYHSTSQLIEGQVLAAKEARARELADQTNRFIFERYADIQVLANLAIFTTPRVSKVLSLQEKQLLLDKYITAYRVYDSIAVFDLKGNLLVKSSSEAPLENQSDRKYFQEVVQTDRAVISNATFSQSSGEWVIHFAAPVKDIATGRTSAILRSRMPVNYLQEALKGFNTNGDTAHLIDRAGEFFVAHSREYLSKQLRQEYPDFPEVLSPSAPAAKIAFNQVVGKNLLVATAPMENLEGLPPLDWVVLIETDPKIALAASDRLLLTVGVGTVLTALIVGAIATALSISVTEPLIERISSTISAIVGSSTAISATVAQQEIAITQQAGACNELTAGVDVLNNSAGESAAQAKAAAHSAGLALQMADGGTRAVERTLEEMATVRAKVGAIATHISHLRSRCGQIARIADMVSDLANQTHLLAFNATVEAVRAGDSGKGFGVVAAEIRLLAERSKQSAQNINVTVADIQAAIDATANTVSEGTLTVDAGVRIAQQTADAFSGVIEAINEVADRNQQISLNAQKQAAAIQEVLEAMNALNQAVQETAGGISLVRAGTEKLNDAAQKLAAIL